MEHELQRVKFRRGRKKLDEKYYKQNYKFLSICIELMPQNIGRKKWHLALAQCSIHHRDINKLKIKSMARATLKHLR